jgi:hypothetical protein
MLESSSHVKQGGESYWLPIAQRGVTEMEAESEPDVCRIQEIQENAPRSGGVSARSHARRLQPYFRSLSI